MRYRSILIEAHVESLVGHQTSSAIRESLSAEIQSLPIVAMTANALAGEKEKCQAAGMSDFISKPVRFEPLARKLVEYQGRKLDDIVAA